MTTEVSSRPRVDSTIDGLVQLVVDVAAEEVGVYMRRPLDTVGDRVARYELTQRHGAKLGYGHSSPGNGDGLPTLDFPKHRHGVVTQLSLGDGTCQPQVRLGVADRVVERVGYVLGAAQTVLSAVIVASESPIGARVALASNDTGMLVRTLCRFSEV